MDPGFSDILKDVWGVGGGIMYVHVTLMSLELQVGPHTPIYTYTYVIYSGVWHYFTPLPSVNSDLSRPRFKEKTENGLYTKTRSIKFWSWDCRTERVHTKDTPSMRRDTKRRVTLFFYRTGPLTLPTIPLISLPPVDILPREHKPWSI